MVDNAAMPKSRTTAHFLKQVGRVCHAFHAARDHHVRVAQRNLVIGDHRSLHARPAHLVQCSGRNLFAQTTLKSSLARRCLTLPRWQNTAHQNLIHRISLRPSKGRFDSSTTQLRGCHWCKVTLEPTHWRARCACNNNVFHNKCSNILCLRHQLVRL